VSETKRWKVGDPVIVEVDSNGYGGGNYTVAAVGPKWLQIDARGRRRRFFRVSDGQERGDGAGGYCYARTPADHQAMLARRAAQKRLLKLTVGVGYDWHRNLSIEQMHAIADILEAAAR